jgi:D-alanyl-D-alanine-carboxypeptidase/D-alanyl-D-alanine-endopeptidase
MSVSKKWFSHVLPALALCGTALAQTPTAAAGDSQSATPASAITGDAVQQAINRAASRLEAGGVIAAEVRANATRYFSAGHPAPRENIPPEKVIFEIGSITKVFTSLLLAQAIVEHRVTLDDPISRYLPPSVALDPTTAAITLEQLATHTSGLPRMPDNFHPKDQLNPFADYTAENLYAFLRSYRSKTPPPHTADYSNVGVGLLGHILELVYQQPYADLIVAKISRPLGLPDTVVNLDDEQKTRFAIPHSGHLAVEALRLQVFAGAGALHSTTTDLVRFAQTLMTPEKNPLRAAWDLAQQPRHDFMGGKIGLNIMILERDGHPVYQHGGATEGSRSHLEWSSQPAQHVLVILENNDTFEPQALVASLYGPKPASGAGDAGRSETPLLAGKATDYAGIYAINATTKFTVMIDDHGRPLLRLTGQPFSPIFYAGEDRFFSRVVVAEVQFSRSPDGAVNSLTLLQNGQEIKALRTDEPLPTVLTLSPEKLQEYAGHYTPRPEMEFDVRVRAGTLVVKLTGQPALAVFPDQPDHFVYDAVKAALTFERSPDGTVTTLVLHQNGRDLRAEKMTTAKTQPPTPTTK